MKQFIKKRPLTPSLDEYKLMQLILTERKKEDELDGLSVQINEVKLLNKIERIILNIESARLFRSGNSEAKDAIHN